MSSPGSSTSSSAAGIVTDASSGQRVVPESRRADGSIRKERKVKPGYTPVEDVARFRPSRVLQARAEERQRVQKGSITSDGRARSLADVNDGHRPALPLRPTRDKAKSTFATDTQQGSVASRSDKKPAQAAQKKGIATGEALAPEWRRVPARVPANRLHAKHSNGAATPDDWDDSEQDYAKAKAEEDGAVKSPVSPVAESRAVDKVPSTDTATEAREEEHSPIEEITGKLASVDIASNKNSASEGTPRPRTANEEKT